MIHSMILGFKHLLKHNMVKTQGKAPAGRACRGEEKQAGITTNAHKLAYDIRGFSRRIALHKQRE